MKRRIALAAALLLASLAQAARAREAACWMDRGMLVVSASVMGIAGDYILDTGTADTELHETRAQGAGLAETKLTGEVRLAGFVEAARKVAVVDLDARTFAMPTPIAGVIGADFLRDKVLDVRFSPCRIGLHRAGRAPAFGPAAVLPLTWRGARPTVAAAVSDGPRAWRGAFIPATGADAAVRLDERVARVPGALRPQRYYPYGSGRAELRALSFAGTLREGLPAGLLPAASGGPDGLIGPPVLARYRLRFDFPRGRLLATPAD